MVATNEGHTVGVADFEAEEEEKGFEGIKTPVNKVACAQSCSQSAGSADLHRPHYIPMKR